MQTTREQLTVDRFLPPICAERPAGQSLRYSPRYEAIAEARREEPDLPQGKWTRPRKVADWELIEKLASDALATESKDLQIAVWLSEAWIRRYGIGGLSAAIALPAQLLQQFGYALHPQTEDNDDQERVNILENFSEDVASAIRRAPLTSEPVYAWLHWRESQRAHLDSEIKGETAGSPRPWPTREQFDQAVAATPRTHWETLLSQLELSHAAYEELVNVVAKKFIDQRPNLYDMREAIKEVIQLARLLIKNTSGPEPDPPVVVSSPESTTTEVGRSFDLIQTGNYHQTFAQPRDRPQALQYLEVGAAYFHHEEPQNPVNCLLDRVLRWLHLPFAQLLPEIVKDKAALADAQDRLGLKGTTEE